MLSCHYVDGRILQELSQMYRTLQFWEKAHMWRGSDARDEMIARCTFSSFTVSTSNEIRSKQGEKDS